MTKKTVLLIVAGIVVLCLVSIGIVAASIGGEASKVDSMLKSAFSSHATADQAKQQLEEAGFTASPSSTPRELIALGPKHSLIFYSSWLTARVTIGEDGKVHGYQVDRESSWF